MYTEYPVLHAYYIQQARPEDHVKSGTGPKGEFQDGGLHGSFDFGGLICWGGCLGGLGRREGLWGFGCGLSCYLLVGLR